MIVMHATHLLLAATIIIEGLGIGIRSEAARRLVHSWLRQGRLEHDAFQSYLVAVTTRDLIECPSGISRTHHDH